MLFLATDSDAEESARLFAENTYHGEHTHLVRPILFADQSCAWREDEDGAWDTSCGQRFELNEGTPAENDMRFCPYCGKPLEQHRYELPEQSEEVAGSGFQW